jgi:hypothetical protein
MKLFVFSITNTATTPIFVITIKYLEVVAEYW